MNENSKFLGLDKSQFLVALVVVLAMGAITNAVTLAYAVTQNSAHRVRQEQLELSQARMSCAQKTYAQKQVELTADLLAVNPGDPPIPGISRATLIRSLKSQRAYRDTFKSLDCRQFNGSDSS